MSAANKFGIRVGSFIPWLLWQALRWVFFHRRANDPAADMARADGIRPSADDEQIHKPEVWETCLRSEIEAFRPGLRGMARDAHLLRLFRGDFPWEASISLFICGMAWRMTRCRLPWPAILLVKSPTAGSTFSKMKRTLQSFHIG
jgi:hypothetical protein